MLCWLRSNYNAEDTDAYVSTEVEYVDGVAPTTRDASMSLLSVTGRVMPDFLIGADKVCMGCFFQYLHHVEAPTYMYMYLLLFTPPLLPSILPPSYLSFPLFLLPHSSTLTPPQTTFNITSPDTSVLLTCHIHDGGTHVNLKLNGNVICDSQAIYGGEESRTTLEGEGEEDGAQEWQTIRSMTECNEPVPVKKGGVLSTTVWYDLAKHPLYVLAYSIHGSNDDDDDDDDIYAFCLIAC